MSRGASTDYKNAAAAGTGASASILVRAESRLVDLQRARERRRTDEDQKSLFAGDRGLEYVAGLQDKEVVWGAATATSGPAAPAASKGYSGRPMDPGLA